MLAQSTHQIRQWLTDMKFKKSVMESSSNGLKTIYYYLGNFGVFEQTSTNDNIKNAIKFITWNPYGDDVRVGKLGDLVEAYSENLEYNPSFS